MARITVEDCLDNVDNRFELVIKATKRARQLAFEGAEPLVPWENDKATVVSLREIAAGKLLEIETAEAEAAAKAAADTVEMEVKAEIESVETETTRQLGPGQQAATTSNQAAEMPAEIPVESNVASQNAANSSADTTGLTNTGLTNHVLGQSTLSEGSTPSSHDRAESSDNDTAE